MKQLLLLGLCGMPLCAMREPSSRMSPDDKVKMARTVLEEKYNHSIDYEELALAAKYHALDPKLAFAIWEFVAKEAHTKRKSLLQLQSLLDPDTTMTYDIDNDDPEHREYEERFQSLIAGDAYNNDLSTLGTLLELDKKHEKVAYVALLKDDEEWAKTSLALAHKKDPNFLARLRDLIDQAEKVDMGS